MERPEWDIAFISSPEISTGGCRITPSLRLTIFSFACTMQNEGHELLLCKVTTSADQAMLTAHAADGGEIGTEIGTGGSANHTVRWW